MGKQLHCRNFGCSLSNANRAFSLGMGSASNYSSGEADSSTPFPAAGIITNIVAHLDTLPAAGTTKIFTIMNGTSSTGIVFTFDDSHLFATSAGPVTIAAGDRLWISYTFTGTPGVTGLFSLSYVWNGVSNVYVGGNQTIGSVTRFFQPFAPATGNSTTAGTDYQAPVAAPGIITGYYVTMPASVGSSGSYKWSIVKNGVVQDGSSGTPDTRLTLANSTSRVSGNTSFSLSVAAGDLIYAQVELVSAPSSKSFCWGMAFTPTNGGESNLMWPLPSVPATAGASAFNGPTLDLLGWSNETGVSGRQAFVADRFKVTSMQVWLNTAPGATKSRTFVNRLNGANGNSSIVISGTNTQGADTSSQTSYTAQDQICFQESANANTPTASIGGVGFTIFMPGGNPPGKSQGGSKKNGGGAVNSFQPGGTICMTIGNPGNSSEVQ